jgi:hypothetical protein
MFSIVRVVVVIALVAVAGFCLFGFMATFEPNDASTQLTWRAVYSVVGLASLAGAIWVAVFRKKRGP